MAIICPCHRFEGPLASCLKRGKIVATKQHPFGRGCDRAFMELWSSWLAQVTVTHQVTGSSPVNSVQK